MAIFREQHAKDPKLGVLALLIKEESRVEMELSSSLETNANISWHWLKQMQTEVMIPAFAEGRFNDGINAGFQQIKSRLKDKTATSSAATSFGAGCAWVRPPVRINFSPATARRRTRNQADRVPESEAVAQAAAQTVAAAKASGYQTAAPAAPTAAAAAATSTPTPSSSSGNSGFGSTVMMAGVLAGVMGLGLYVAQDQSITRRGKQAGDKAGGKKDWHESDGEELMMMALDGLSETELEFLSEWLLTLDVHRQSSLLLSMAPLSIEEKVEVVRAHHARSGLPDMRATQE
jgi:uncharacterized membrane protein YgcG